MSEDRRERYAAAIQQRATGGIKLNSILPEVYDAADAAMAVADAEQCSLRAEVDGLDEALRGLISASEKDNNRLRSELASSKAAHRAVWSKHQERGARIFELQGENGRLREEIGEDRDGICTGMHADVAEAWSEIERLRATIQRVRSVLDRTNPGEYVTNYSRERERAIRAALEGEQS